MSIIDCKRSFPIKKYSSHSHKTWEIVCQLEGEVVTQVEDKVFTLSAGEITAQASMMTICKIL